MTDKIIEIAIAALIAGLVMTVVHLLAVWNSEKLRGLSKPPTSYMVGTTVIGVPYLVLLWCWGAEKWYFYAFAVIVAVSGAPIIAGHVAKKFKTLRAENEVLRGGLDEYDEKRRLAVRARSVEGAGREPPWTGGMD